jgi:hypothetical protein
MGWLLGKVGWTCQRPTERALQRDEPAIGRWKKQRWPKLKKTQQQRRTIVRAGSANVRTAAGRGRPEDRPRCLQYSFNWKTLRPWPRSLGGIFTFSCIRAAFEVPKWLSFLRHVELPLNSKLAQVVNCLSNGKANVAVMVGHLGGGCERIGVLEYGALTTSLRYSIISVL